MKNPYMKFQNPSMYGLEVMLCIKKRNGRTHGRTDARTHARTHKRPRSNMPLQLLRSWGHKETEEIVAETKERGREERGTGMKVKKQRK